MENNKLSNKSTVFISYAREDEVFVQTKLITLSEFNIELKGDWLLTPGDDYEKRLKGFNLEAHALIFVISPDSISSPACINELSIAVECKKQILPISYRNHYDDDLLDSALRSPQWTFMREGDDLKLAISQLAKAIKTDFVLMDVHSRLLTATDNWVNNNKNKSYLLRGNNLKEAENWFAKVAIQPDKLPQPTPLESNYILTSRRTENKTLRGVIVAVGIAFLITFGLMIFSYTEYAKAEARQITATARQLASQALSYIDIQLDRALLISSEAFDKENNLETRSSLLSALGQSPHLKKFLHSRLAFAWSIKISPNGKILISGHANGTIMFWNLVNGKPLSGSIIGHSGSVNVLAFNPDGETAASAGNDGTIIIWDIKTYKAIDTLTNRGNNITALAYSCDGNILASGGADKKIILWDTITGSSIDTLAAHKDGVYCLAFSPDRKTLASGSFDETIILWDLVTHKPKGKTLDEHGGKVYTLAFNNDGTLLASGSDGDANKNLIIWDVVNHISLGDYLIGHTAGVTDIHFSITGDTMFTCGADRQIIQWNMNTYKQTDDLFFGHQDQINCIALSPNGKILVSSSWDNNIIVWDLSTRNVLGQNLYRHPFAVQDIILDKKGDKVVSGDSHGSISYGEVKPKIDIKFSGLITTEPNCLAVSSDKKVLVSGHKDGTITFWDIASRQLVYPATKIHDGSVNCISFNKENSIVATGSDDGTIKLWDVNSHKLMISSINIHRGGVNDLALSSDGHIMAACFDRSTVVLFDTKTWKTLQYIVLTGEDGYAITNITSINFAQNCQNLIVGNSQIGGNKIYILNIKTGRIIKKEGAESVQSLAYNLKRSQIASGDFNGTIKITNILSGKTKEYKPTIGNVNGLSYSPNGEQLAVSHNGNKIIRIYDMRHGRISDSLMSKSDGINDVIFIDDHMLASANNDRTITIWNLKNHKSIGSPLRSPNNYVNCLALSPIGGTVASGDKKGFVSFWDLEKQSIKGLLETQQKNVSYVDFSPDGSQIATCSSDTSIKLWSIVGSKVSFAGSFPKMHKAGIACVKFSPDGKSLASAGSDGLVIIWSIYNRKPLIILPKRHSKEVKRVVFSADGKILASSGSDRMIFLWDLLTYTPIGHALMAHKNVIWSLAFSSDSKLLASGGDDGKINLWDVQTQNRFGATISASDQVWALAFGPNNKYLLSGQEDGTVTRWNLNPEKWSNQAKYIANMNQ